MRRLCRDIDRSVRRYRSAIQASTQVAEMCLDSVCFGVPCAGLMCLDLCLDSGGRVVSVSDRCDWSLGFKSPVVSHFIILTFVCFRVLVKSCPVLPLPEVQDLILNRISI